VLQAKQAPQLTKILPFCLLCSSRDRQRGVKSITVVDLKGKERAKSSKS
jgi:hypothetical protein